MPHYKVKRKVLRVENVRVEASSPAEAREMAHEGQGELCKRQPSPQYCVVDLDDWDVEED